MINSMAGYPTNFTPEDRYKANLLERYGFSGKRMKTKTPCIFLVITKDSVRYKVEVSHKGKTKYLGMPESENEAIKLLTKWRKFNG